MHKEVKENNSRMWTKLHLTNNARTNFLPFNDSVGEHVSAHHAIAHHPKLVTTWIGPMHIVDTKSHLVFVVEDLHRFKKLFGHAQRHTLPSAKRVSYHWKIVTATSWISSRIYSVSRYTFWCTCKGWRISNSSLIVSMEQYRRLYIRTVQQLERTSRDGKILLHSTGRSSVKNIIVRSFCNRRIPFLYILWGAVT